MANNNKQTSQEIGSLAASVLSDPNSSKIQKQLAGSALSQAQSSKQTGSQVEEIASKALSSHKYSSTTKSLAGSVLAQSNKKR
jgi:hypothetical protein